MKAKDEPTAAELEAAAWAKAHEGKNDPNYREELAAKARDLRTVEATVASVQIVGGSDPQIRVRCGRRPIGAVVKTAMAIGRLADAPVINAEAFRAPNGYRQPPRHTFYRDDQED